MTPAQLTTLLQTALRLHREGRGAEAEQNYRRVRVAAPRNFDAFFLSGSLAQQENRLGPAREFLSKARQLDPQHAGCALRLGMVLAAGREFADAETHLRAAVKLNPAQPEAWDGLAYTLKLQDRIVDALAVHRDAVAQHPNYARGWYNYGLTLLVTNRLAEALACQDRALALDPGYVLARFGRAQVLHRANRVREAEADYTAFLQSKPHHVQARSFRLFALQNLPDVSREQLFAEHGAYGKLVGAEVARTWPNAAQPGRRLRVAILSPDLREHSCAYFIEPLLAHLPKDEFELYLYHDHFREDTVSERLRAHATVWRNFVGQAGAAVEQAIRADAPDILIDLSGHTGVEVRLPLFARRLAPVQITYLGYPDTTGVAAMDYRFTDEHADPVGDADRFHTEQLVRFAPAAWTYAPTVEAPEVGDSPMRRNGYVTFGCFNNLAKVTDATLERWVRLLARVPDARLCLKGHGLSDPAGRVRYLAPFAAAGVAAERIVLLEHAATTAEHLASYREIDVALDTFPYHGTTTTCEALWMGVPVISLAGDRHVSRVGVSLLNAIGHSEWIARDEEDHVRIAAELASSPEKLAKVRAGLRTEMAASPLMAYTDQAARFARALRSCWKNWCARAAGSASSGTTEVSSPEACTLTN